MTTVSPPRVGGGRVLLHLVAKLLLIFGLTVGIASGLCILLVRRVRAHDAALGLATSKLDALSLRNLSSLQELQRSHETFLHVFAVQFPLALACFACIYVLKQTFAIPGSALLNVFAGAVLPLSLAFPLVCILTACGASCCFLLSKSLASEDIVFSLSERLLPGKLHALRQKVEDARERGQLPFLLLFLRVFPFTPNWFLNMASPWLQVPLKLFAPSVAVGLLPYNFVTVHAGAMLSSLRSTSDLLDPRTMVVLVLLAIGMLIPALLKKKAKGRETRENAKSNAQSVSENSSKKTD
ncbi:hypothetical protein BBJ29_005014 [Phytophthora kernoviae]|uniref:VTT domain-containing protein n=1 Tax=Phytophthora kernoviae TaxID=325452 RepID=A0A3F2RG97_9STRA|nr:hypothetical protein BBP00_00008119 [Phytophthora kernoviae]RLN71406.1 hypothetical protein BBJ29_005014 [Phytophthora kernoviae]